ncbi:hypothetical protein Tco_0968526 [Tanacetum coccineum]
MVAYLEKTYGNAEFHEIMDFLTCSSIHYALTVSPVVFTTFVEHFWMTAKSKTINNVRYITAIVVGKPVLIKEASIRSDLQFNDVVGIDVLLNHAIFDTIQLMGYEGDLNTLTFNKELFSPQWKFLFHTIIYCLSSKSTSWDQIPTNIATVVICLATNQVYNFSKLIFDGMMRHLDAKKKFVMYPRFIPVFLTNQLKNVPVPFDHFPINALTTKVQLWIQKVGCSASEGEEPEDLGRIIQDIDDDPLVSLVRESMKMKEKSTNFVTPTKALREAQEEDISPTILEAAKTFSKVASQGVRILILDWMLKKRLILVEKKLILVLKRDWDVIRAKLEVNAEVTKDVLGKDLHEQDFAKRMVDMVNQRKKHFAEERAKAKRNKPMTQRKSCLSKGRRAVKRTGKRKKQKARKGISVDKNAQGDSETDKEESVEAMNPTPLATKSNIVVNWKIFQQGQRSIYQIIRANRADTVYMSFGAMVKDLTKEDLIELYMMVMQKYGTNRPKDSYDRVLWSDLRTMFDPPLNEDAIWSLPLQQKMINWRKYPLSKDACQVMLKLSLLDEHWIGKQTTTGKENSNPLIADSLLKTISCDEEKTKTKRQKKLRT